eukprot:1870926-Prymnesium_polylepis.1
MPIASNLAHIFGFQEMQPHARSADMSSSNVACQVDHLCSLLVNRMQPRRLDGLEGAFRLAVGELHAKTFANYHHWCRHLGVAPAGGDAAALPRSSSGTSGAAGSWTQRTGGWSWRSAGPSPWSWRDADSSARGTRAVRGSAAAEKDAAALSYGVVNLQLHDLLLFFLIWGEAANVRHMPEALCFIFYCARMRLRFPRTADMSPVNRLCESALPEAHDASANEFLYSIVTPVYRYLAREILSKKDDKIWRRVMYCDVNEAFWRRETLEMVEAEATAVNKDLYAALQNVLKEGDAPRQGHGRRGGLQRYGSHGRIEQLFFKTYLETVS